MQAIQAINDICVWIVKSVEPDTWEINGQGGKGTIMFTSDLATGTYDIMYDDLYTRVRYTPSSVPANVIPPAALVSAAALVRVTAPW